MANLGVPSRSCLSIDVMMALGGVSNATPPTLTGTVLLAILPIAQAV